MTQQGFRLSPVQRRLWTLHAEDSGAAYVAQCAVRVDGPLDTEVLHRRLLAEVGRYEILRTGLRSVSALGVPVQVIGAVSAPAWEEVAAGTGGHDFEDACRTSLASHRQEPFDLTAGPLLRLTVVHGSDRTHALLITASAFVADGASLTGLVDALARGYAEELGGGPSAEGEEEPLQYADLAEWLGELLESEETADGRAQWRKTLGRLDPGVLRGDLPPAGGAAASAGAAFVPRPVAVSVASEPLARLEEAAHARGLSTASLALACWYLLARQLYGTELRVGLLTDGRNDPELGDVIGPLERLVPMPVHPPGDGTLSELAVECDHALNEAAQLVGYFDWDAAVAPDGRTAGLPVSFGYADVSGVGGTYGDVTFGVSGRDTCADRSGLRLSCVRRGTDLVAEVHHDPALVGTATATRLAGRLASLLERAADLLDTPCGLLDLLDEAERRELTTAGEGRELPPGGGCLHDLFEDRVREHPDRTALVCGSDTLTYAELSVRSNRLANHLRDLGIGPEDLVGLCLEPSLDLMTAVLAVWKAGGGYVPLDPQSPPERLARQIRDSGMRILVTGSGTESGLADPAGGVESVRMDLPHWTEAAATPPDSGVSERNSAYLIYTSGSTGGPKGVLVEHYSVVRFADAMRTGVHGDDRAHRQVALNAALTFDASVQQIVQLLDGHTLHVLPTALRRDDRLLVEYVQRQGIDVLNCTPTQLQTLVDAGLLAAGEHRPRRILAAGEALPAPLWQRLAAVEGVSAFNIYGPTECTVNATAVRIDAGRTTPVIGGPLPEYRIRILDTRSRQVPVGVPGEIHIGGPALARGYAGRPGLTAERFVPDPFADRPGSRLYRTGDLGRFLPDGQVEFLGRLDDQVKVHGFRIEPGEIEEALRGHPGVRDAVVVARGTAGDGARLAAYLVARGPSAPQTDELRDYLGQRLPHYMVPAVYVALDAFPVNANGKLDRRALPDPDAARPLLGSVYAAPGTTRERVLAEIVGSVLGVDRVGVDDNFFSLGGDSIRSIQVRARAAEQGLHFSIQQLFRCQTVRELAAVLAPERDSAGEEPERTAPFAALTQEERALLPEDVVDAGPLSRMQAGMVFHSEFHSQEPLFHNIRTIHLRMAWDAGSMRRALDDISTEHALLRTSFDLTTFREPLQLVHRQLEIPLLHEDLGDLDHQAQERHLAAFRRAEESRRFDWETGPLIRFAVHRRSEESAQVTLTVHEAITDGWSVASLLSELFTRYLAHLAGAPSALAPPRSEYRDFVEAERRALDDEGHRGFWRTYLDGLGDTRLPRWPLASGEAARGERAHLVVEVPVGTETSDGLHALATGLGVPLKSVVFAAHLRVLAALSDTEEAVTGLVVNGRLEVPDGERVIGQFLNTLPVRMKVSGGTWNNLVRAAFAAEQELLEHRRYPVALVHRAEGGESLVDHAFNFTHFHVYQGLFEGSGAEVLDDDFFERTDLALLADFSVDAESSRIRLVLNCNGLTEAQVSFMAQHYADCLAAMAADPAAPHRAVRLVDDSARERIVSEWNDTGRPFPAHADYAQLFELQAARTPDATAIAAGADSVTFRELDRRANRLAHLLVARGVGPEERVALVMDRGVDHIVAVLAVFKAGGAVLPLDPDDPPGRLGRAVREGAARVVLHAPEHRTALRAALSDGAGEHSAVMLPIDDPAQENLPDTGGFARALPGSLAYTIFTSGSTGEPQGVLIEQRSMLNHLYAKIHDLGLGPTDRVAQIAPLTFDISLWQYLAVLLAGGQVVVIPDAVRRDAARLLPELAASGVTVAQLVPTHLRAVLDAESTAPTALPDLRRLLSTGETLPPALARRWARHSPAVPLSNVYGPTECTDNVAGALLDGMREGPRCPIGRPLPNTTLYVLNRRLEPVPCGMPGELYIGGAAVGRGYQGDPAATAERFVPDPFTSGGRLHRTGDLVVQNSDGVLEHLGRLDRQLKVNGVRIEPAEVEQALTGHPGVGAAVLTARQVAGRQALVAYVVAVGPTAPGPDALRAWLLERLPEALVPALFVSVSEVPLTSSGKTDAGALPEPLVDRCAREPETDVEKRLVQVWEELLGVPPMGVDESFFGLGGDSFRGTQLIARIRKGFGVEVPLRRFFAQPTVAALATMITDASGQRAGGREPS
ncbi:amino acid adenylation domain-containing protein [Streptomyces sp. NPDC087866]|uniref:amino acid adenylation domain-containing protein n=1 Tax=Streptomyces sp. NPDC087866 TaxID=3365815 RepID=UPI0038126E2F